MVGASSLICGSLSEPRRCLRKMLLLTVHKYHPLPLALGADLACPFPEDRASEKPKSCRFELLLNL